jgi:hypothetical protein
VLSCVVHGSIHHPYPSSMRNMTRRGARTKPSPAGPPLHLINAHGPCRRPAGRPIQPPPLLLRSDVRDIENAQRRGARSRNATTDLSTKPPSRGEQYTSGSRAARAHDTRGLHRRSRNHHPTQLPSRARARQTRPGRRRRARSMAQWREEKGRARQQHDQTSAPARLES